MSSSAGDAAHAMRRAFLERDPSVLAPTLADDVVFHSPVLERPWTTRAVVERLGPAMVSVFEDVAFAPVVTDGGRAILPFAARRGPVRVQAVAVLDVGDDGKVAELTMYIRPLPGLIAVAKAMEARLDRELLAAHLT
jgi:hypothetical protein